MSSGPTRPRAAAPRVVSFVVTCEHGGNRIPRAYADLFRGKARILRTHRGYDHGALAMAERIAAALHAVRITSTVSRLLVELNRSPHHRNLFSKAMRAASPQMREEVRRRYYEPYRARVEHAVRAAVDRGSLVVHLSSHSFAPRVRGEVRRADVGLLYDPSRAHESKLCRRWQAAIHELAPRWRVRRNYPYRGTADGLTRYLRRCFSASQYAGIELEVNQKRLRGDPRACAGLRTTIVNALRQALASSPPGR